MVRVRSTRPWMGVLLAGAILLVGACGGQSDQEEAATLLQHGLDAHAAGDIQQAQADYRRVLVLDPSNKFAYYNLGLIAQNQGDAAAAEQNYRITLGIDPNFEPALYNLAIVVTPTDPNEALDLYRRAVEADPTDASAHLNLGLLLIDQGQLSAGESEIQQAIALDPSLASRVPSPLQSPSPTPSPSGEPTESPSG